VSDGSVIGFVGLGAMGAPIVDALADAGHELVVHDTDPKAIAPAVARGAADGGSPAELARRCDLVFASLPRPEVVRAVAIGPGGLLEGDRMQTYVDLSTTGAAVAAEVAGTLGVRGVDVLDAPVSGGVAGARARTLAVMVAGEPSVFERVRPLFELFGANVFHVGTSPGQGQIAKLLNNLLSATAMAITSEAVAFGIRAGLDPATLVHVFNAGTGRNTATAAKFPEQVLTGRFASGFRLELMAKDLELCLEETASQGHPMPIGSVVRRVWSDAAAEADPGADHTELVRYVERLTGVDVAPAG
jgi:3-hydroxyisobutyrate dehydrogenase-like beta-hydroxyacid dehydrogenase